MSNTYRNVKGPGDFEPIDDGHEYEPSDEDVLEKAAEFVADDAHIVADAIISLATAKGEERERIINFLVECYAEYPCEKLIEEYYA